MNTNTPRAFSSLPGARALHLGLSNWNALLVPCCPLTFHILHRVYSNDPKPETLHLAAELTSQEET